MPIVRYDSRIKPSARPSNVAKAYNRPRLSGDLSRAAKRASSVPRLPTIEMTNALEPSRGAMNAPPAVKSEANPSSPRTMPRNDGRSAAAVPAGGAAQYDGGERQYSGSRLGQPGEVGAQ